MSALPSAAARRLFIFGSQIVPPSFLERLSDFPKLSGVTPASHLEVRPTPEMVTSGIREIDALTGGFPRGCLTEICGPASSGRTSVLLAALAASTRRAEVCALVDAGNTLDPHSAAAAGIDLEKLLGALREKETKIILHRRTSIPTKICPSSIRFFASQIYFCRVMVLG
jgi:RecA/RadA recombinase